MRSRSTPTDFIREDRVSASRSGMAMVSTVAAAATATIRANMNCPSVIFWKMRSNMAAVLFRQSRQISKLIILRMTMMPTNIQTAAQAMTKCPVVSVNSNMMYLGEVR